MLFPVAIPARSIHNHHVTRGDLKAKSSMHFAIFLFSLSTTPKPAPSLKIVVFVQLLRVRCTIAGCSRRKTSGCPLSNSQMRNDKSPSSASTSPCPSPVGAKVARLAKTPSHSSNWCALQKSHRLLPTNLYVVLYNFKSRHQDELDLKAGYKVTVIDTSDPDWWKGKCLGRVGFFPSKYVSKLSPGRNRSR
jgi:hypothetical protein